MSKQIEILLENMKAIKMPGNSLTSILEHAHDIIEAFLCSYRDRYDRGSDPYCTEVATKDPALPLLGWDVVGCGNRTGKQFYYKEDTNLDAKKPVCTASDTIKLLVIKYLPLLLEKLNTIKAEEVGRVHATNLKLASMKIGD